VALSRDLHIATPFTAAQVASELYRVALDIGLLLESTAEEKMLEGVVTASGTWLRAISTNREPSHPVTTSFGFQPTVFAVFAPNKFSDFDLQSNDMVQMVSGILDHVPGDLVLHYQHETIWMLRLGDDLSISDRDDLWPPHRMALLAQPYQHRSLAFPG
jgi:hypothetical protein